MIRTLGIYQPYATLMGHSKLETRLVKRGRKLPFPFGKYLLYSTKKAYSKSEFMAMAGDSFEYGWRLYNLDPTSGLLGHALFTAELVHYDLYSRLIGDRCFLDSIEQDDEGERALWCLYFENVTRIVPFPIQGKQGVGFLSKADENRIREYTPDELDLMFCMNQKRGAPCFQTCYFKTSALKTCYHQTK